MFITKKKKYALRAVYELARRHGQGYIKTIDIAAVQAIPSRFLERILSRLKRSGMIMAKRGFRGGYQLAMPPDQITIGQVLKLMEEFEHESECVECISKQNCALAGNCAFIFLWRKVKSAIDEVYDQTTMADLLMEQENLWLRTDNLCDYLSLSNPDKIAVQKRLISKG